VYNILTPFIHAFNPPFSSYELWFALKSIGLITEFGLNELRSRYDEAVDEWNLMKSPNRVMIVRISTAAWTEQSLWNFAFTIIKMKGF
jgi:hypothetical protein